MRPHIKEFPQNFDLWIFSCLMRVYESDRCLFKNKIGLQYTRKDGDNLWKINPL